jgi:putative Holliday junction resolvase
MTVFKTVALNHSATLPFSIFGCYQKKMFYASILPMIKSGPQGRFLGIDYGTKRIGLAISDEGATLAFPKEVLLNDKNTFSRLAEVVKSENIIEIVVGESTNFAGGVNPVGSEIEAFISELTKYFPLPIRKQKEFLTSVEARRYKDKDRQSGVDAGAAALILQRYLDLVKKTGGA